MGAHRRGQRWERVGSSRVGGIRGRDEGRWSRADASLRGVLAWVGMLGVAIVVLGLAAVGAPRARAAGQTPADKSGSISIQIPAPSGTTASGPVGTNVSFAASGLAAGDTYQLGYALQTVTCDAGFTPFAGVSPFSPGGDGSLSSTISWPSAAGQVGSQYYLCLQDTTTSGTPDVVSTQTFQVNGSTAPSITVAATTPQTGNGQGGNGNGGTTVPDGQVTITGKNFLENVNLAVYLVNQTKPAPNNLNTQSQLNPDNGGPITPDSGGNFSATVTLPPGYAKQWTLVVATTDGTDALPPSLMATKQINIVAAATPTPTPSPTATTAPQPSPTASAGTGGTGNGTNKNVSSATVAGIIGLSALAIILFVAGVLLLSSTLTTPRRPGQ